MRWLAVVVAVAFSTAVLAQSAPHCTTGIPCGNSCISSGDTCHVGGGTASTPAGPDNSDVIFTVIVVAGVVVLVAGLIVAVVAGNLAIKHNEEDASSDSSSGSYVPSVDGLNDEGRKIFRNCLITLCGLQSTCRENQTAELRAAPNKTAWLKENCASDMPASAPSKPKSPPRPSPDTRIGSPETP